MLFRGRTLVLRSVRRTLSAKPEHGVEASNDSGVEVAHDCRGRKGRVPINRLAQVKAVSYPLPYGVSTLIFAPFRKRIRYFSPLHVLFPYLFHARMSDDPLAPPVSLRVAPLVLSCDPAIRGTRELTRYIQ